MGTGGATALLSPEGEAALAFRCYRSEASAKPNLWGRRRRSPPYNLISKEHDFNPQSLLVL
jgi:hypothetical protein